MLDEKILSVLRNNPDSYVSGEELCKSAGLSRTAIWKHIEKLRAEGYGIDAYPHIGYKLISIPDLILPNEVKWGLKARILGREIISYKKVDSTNIIAYGLAEKGVKDGIVIISEEQTGGKGRQGRRWVSPPKGGIYLSCILRPNIAPSIIPQITLTAAVSVTETIREMTGLKAMIKWPNGVLINGKKVCAFYNRYSLQE